MNASDRNLLDEMFKGVNARLDANFELLHQDIKYVKEQTTKTNGSVANLLKRMHDVEVTQSSCPAEDFKEYKKDMEVTHFFTKHPNILRYTLIGMFMVNVLLAGLLIYVELI